MSLTDETRRVIELLRHHHTTKQNQWATFVELRNGTGMHSITGIDFFAVNTWPSKHFHTIAYEIKVSRSDFAKELQWPDKRAFAESVANQCMFVVPNGLVRPDEVPEGWGLIYADAGGLKTVKHGTQKRDVSWPKSFVMSMVRRAADAPPSLPLAAWKVEGKEIGEAELIAIAEYTLQTKLADEKSKLRREGRDQFTASPAYQRLVDLQLAVAKAIDRRWAEGTTAEDFELWLGGYKAAISHQDLQTIQHARDALDAILARVYANSA